MEAPGAFEYFRGGLHEPTDRPAPAVVNQNLDRTELPHDTLVARRYLGLDRRVTLDWQGDSADLGDLLRGAANDVRASRD
jgi:hypothetical protein